MNRLQKVKSAYFDLPDELRLFAILVCALTTVSLASAVLWRSLGYGLPYSAPYYFVPKDLFQDFQAFRPRFGTFGTADFFTKPPHQYVMYPAPLIFPIAFFLHSAHPIRTFLLFVLSAVSVFTYIFHKTLRAARLSAGSSVLFTSVSLITSYPILFLIQRGNLEVLTWVPVTLGLLFFTRKQYVFCAICFGVATSLKLYPFIFLCLLLVKRRYREVCLGLATAVAITLVALWRLGPTISQAFRWNSVQLAAFGKYFAASEWALGYDHSLFSLVKLVTLAHHPDLTPYVRIYSASAACLGVFLYAAFLRRIPTLNQILVLSVLTIILPPVSYDYTLLSLYAPFTILCTTAISNRHAKGTSSALRTLMVLFAFIFTPQSYIVFAGARYGAQLRCICLLAIIIIALFCHLPEEQQSPLQKKFA